MRYRVFAAIAVAAGLALWAPGVQAGAVRYAGKEIAKGSTAVASAAASGGATVAGGVASAGHSTKGAMSGPASAVGNGATTVAKGVVATPGVVARGSKSAAKTIWHGIW